MIIEYEVCWMGYCDDIAADRRQHERKHRQLTACRHGEFFIPYHERERMKHDDARRLRDSGEHVAAFEVVITAHYARSLEASGFSDNHPSPEEYRAMRLNQPGLLVDLPENAGRELIARYGQKPGIVDGCSYWGRGSNKYLRREKYHGDK